jgi:hypothetical protein
MVKPSFTAKKVSEYLAEFTGASKRVTGRAGRLVIKNATATGKTREEADAAVESGTGVILNILKEFESGMPNLRPCELFLYGKCTKESEIAMTHFDVE